MKNKDLLLEIGCEDLPARFLKLLEHELFIKFKNNLNRELFEFSNYKTFVTPRRIAILIHQINIKQPAKKVTKKGPSIKFAFDEKGAPTKALLGFAKSNNTSVEQLEKKRWLYVFFY